MKLAGLLERARAVPLPATLVLCNLAGTQRRNGHLGVARVDADIAEFGAALERTGEGVAARVAGDAWLALTARPEALVAAVVAAYARAEPFLAGWRATATRDGERREAEAAVRTTIRRSARFVGERVARAEEIAAVAARLAEVVGRVPVDLYHDVADARLEATAPWCAVERYPEARPCCPFCRGEAFDWTDCDTCVYGTSGRCRGCGAEVSVRDVAP